MNTENIKKLIDHLRNEVIDGPPDDPDDVCAFDMSQWAFPCGAPACIAGHAALMNGVNLVELSKKRVIGSDLPFVSFVEYHKIITSSAAEYLGVDLYTADDMFAPTNIVLGRVSPKDAADMLERYLLTNEVVWAEELIEEEDEDYDYANE